MDNYFTRVVNSTSSDLTLFISCEDVVDSVVWSLVSKCWALAAMVKIIAQASIGALQSSSSSYIYHTYIIEDNPFIEVLNHERLKNLTVRKVSVKALETLPVII